MIVGRCVTSVAVITLLMAHALSAMAEAQTPDVPPPAAANHDADEDAQPLETGLPLLHSFSPKDYDAQPQNWAIVQDPRGLIYVGNGEGVLEFDGQRWRLIRVANDTTVRSLALDAQGQVYVGANGEIGYLAPDASGQMRYVSLLHRVPPEARDFADVFDIFVTPQGVVFSSFQRLMRLHGDQFESWTPAAAFHLAFQVGDRLFIRESGRGLLELRDGQLRPLPGGDRFADEKIFAMLAGKSTTPTAPPSILIGARNQGFFILDRNGLTPWPTAIDAELKRDLLYRATGLPDGRLALATLQGGLYLIDAQGGSLGHLSVANGLPSDSIYALSLDREGGLWIATGNGLARAEVGSGLSRFDERSGLAGATYGVHRHQGLLYVATAQGLFRLLPGAAAKFERIPGIDGQTWALLTVNEELLVGNYQGVYTVAGGSATLIKAFDAAGSLQASQAQPGRVFVGLRAGLAALRQVEGRWRYEGPVPGIDDNVRNLLEDRDAQLWLGTRTTGVLRVSVPPATAKDTLTPLRIERFGVAEGLPSLNGNRVYLIAGEPRFGTEAGINRFDEAQHRFEADPRFVGLFPDPRWVINLETDPERGIWLYSEDQISGLKETGLVARQADGRFRWDSSPLRALQGDTTLAIHHDLDDVVWFGSAEGLTRYDPRIAKTYTRPFPALLRRVSTRADRLLFAGSGTSTVPELDHTDNALRFDYAAPSFDGMDDLRFQVKLEGAEDEWSDWSAENYKDYNNLREGDYRFRVRAKNLYDTVSSEAVYAFAVLPPWYRSVWAYFVYLLALGGTAWGTFLWRLRRLLAQRRRLEATVTERTADILKFAEIGKELTATLDIEQAFERVYRQIAARVDAFTFAIAIHHPEEGLIRMQYVIERGRRLPSFDIALAETNHPAVWCLCERRELIAATSAELLNYVQVKLPAKTGEQRESVVYLPLISEDRAIGCLCVLNPRQHAYTPAQLEFLRVLASYAAIALDKASAHQELAQSRDELAQRGEELLRGLAEVEQMNRQVSMLAELTGFLQACSTAEEAFTCIGEFGPRLFSGSRGVLYLHDVATQAWIRHGGWGTLADADVERFTDADRWALRRGLAYRFDSSSDSPCCPHLRCSDTQRPIYVCLPLTAQGKTFGLLHIEHVELLEGNADERRYGIAIALAEQIALAIANVQLREALLQQSIRDPLTGLYNRRFLQEAMLRELARAKRERTPLALLMIDVDHFKRCNDRFGHPAGDHVLKNVARVLAQTLRAGHLACRFGGEEFAVLLPGCDLECATRVAERILEGMRGLVLSHEGRALDPVTASLGIAVFPQHGGDLEGLIKSADGALYAAKESGRDRLMIGGQS